MADKIRDFEMTDVKETGRQFSAACLSPFLNTGAIFASVQSLGNSPLSRDFWQMMVMKEIG